MSRHGPPGSPSILMEAVSHREGHDLLVFVPDLGDGVQIRLFLKTHLDYQKSTVSFRRRIRLIRGSS
jgi:hypothetical protein